MRKVSLLLSILVGSLVVASSCTQSPEEPPPEEGIRIEVNRQGFNGTPGEFRLEVEEGQEVEITFVYGDSDFPENNPHVIAIPALGIEASIDRDNQEDTVRFTANETGEITFMCTKVDCVGHTNLLQGIIVIAEEGHGHAEEEEHD